MLYGEKHYAIHYNLIQAISAALYKKRYEAHYLTILPSNCYESDYDLCDEICATITFVN